MINLKSILAAFILTFFLNSIINAQSDSISVATQEEPTQTEQKQEKPKKSAKDKIYYGGNIGLSFGSYTVIGIYPLIGYKLTPKLSLGAQLSYQFVRDKRYSETRDLSNYGGSLFARYRIVPPLYAHAEYAVMNYELYNALGESSRQVVPFALLGAGYSKNVGGNTWVYVQLLWDVLQDSNSPYENKWEPFVSFGIGVGF